MVVAYRQSSKD